MSKPTIPPLADPKCKHCRGHGYYSGEHWMQRSGYELCPYCVKPNYRKACELLGGMMNLQCGTDCKVVLGGISGCLACDLRNQIREFFNG